jgi:hypothetical protein
MMRVQSRTSYSALADLVDRAVEQTGEWRVQVRTEPSKGATSRL